jgi:predicted dehydrogenase
LAFLGFAWEIIAHFPLFCSARLAGMIAAMSTKLQWGVIGTGAIARSFAKGLAESRHGTLTAIGSRSRAAAEAFAKDFPATCHVGYDALIADPDIQAVYISTPHCLHAEWAIRAAEAGKHVLCEKPLAMNRDEAQAAIETARRHGVFLMEGFMYRCHPQTRRLAELVRECVVGELKLIRATFSFCHPFDPRHRLFDPALGGGGILDVGCYCISLARLVAGAAHGEPFADPVEIKGTGVTGSTGVDEYAVASLKFSGGILAQVAAGVQLDLENNVRLVGTEGSILVPTPWIINGPGGGFSKILVFKGHIPDEIVVQSDRGLYALEADHVAEMVAEGRCESPLIPWDDSLGNMEVLDEWRRQVDGTAEI